MSTTRTTSTTPTARFVEIEGTLCLVGAAEWDNIAFRISVRGEGLLYFGGFTRFGHSSFVFDYCAISSETRTGYVKVVERVAHLKVVEHVLTGSLRRHAALAATALPGMMASFAASDMASHLGYALFLGVVFGGIVWGVMSVLRWIVECAVSNQVDMIEGTPFPDEYLRVLRLE